MYDPSEALLQLGLYDYVWGNPALLQTYNANVQAAKAREEQAQYNKLWKQIEDDKAKAAAEQARKQELKEAGVEMAKLNRDLINATPQEAVIIRKQQEALINKYNELAGYNSDAIKAKAEEDAYQAKKVGFIGGLPKTYKDDAEIQKTIDSVVASDLRSKDKEDIIGKLQGLKSTAQMAAEARQSAVASHSGKKTTENLETKDRKKKLADSGRKKIANGQPGRVTIAEQTAIDEGY